MKYDEKIIYWVGGGGGTIKYTQKLKGLPSCKMKAQIY